MAYSSYNLNTLFSKDNTLDLNNPKSGMNGLNKNYPVSKVKLLIVIYGKIYKNI